MAVGDWSVGKIVLRSVGLGVDVAVDPFYVIEDVCEHPRILISIHVSSSAPGTRLAGAADDDADQSPDALPLAHQWSSLVAIARPHIRFHIIFIIIGAQQRPGDVDFIHLFTLHPRTNLTGGHPYFSFVEFASHVVRVNVGCRPPSHNGHFLLAPVEKTMSHDYNLLSS